VSEPTQWGRVAEDGTVLVRTSDGERVVGQWPGGDPAEAIAFYVRRYEGLGVEVDLLERRVRTATLSPRDATSSIASLRDTVRTAPAVGDLAALTERLDALEPVVASQREERKATKARQLDEAKAAKERITGEAERIARGDDWRAGVVRLRALLDEWKVLPRLDKAVDEAMWRRFSAARTAFSRRRKQHFAEQNEQREAAAVTKKRLVAEAEELTDSTDWGATSRAYRDLMNRWKAAGPAPRGVDDKLWRQFRAAQDSFFRARDESHAAQDKQFAANAEVKRQILTAAEALLPVTDVGHARAALRDLADRWEAAGKVPREDMQVLEGRMRAVEEAVRRLEQDRWKHSNPEGAARAADTVAQLESSLADLRSRRDQAAAAGDDRTVRDTGAAIEAREAWLVQARQALTDFTP